MGYALNIVITLVLIFVGYAIYKKFILPNTLEKERIKEGFDPFKLIAGLFQLIPIVINVFAHIDKVFDAFLNASLGLIFSIVNVSIASSFMFTDSFRFAFAMAKFGFKSVICSLQNLSNMKYCIWFYAWDMFILALQVVIMSLLELIDTQFKLGQKLGGHTLVGSLESAGEKMMELDAKIHDSTGFHVFAYPDSIISLCYTCKNPPDKNELLRNTAPLKKDIFVKMPPLIDEPIGYFINAGMDLADVFSGF